MIGNSSNQQLVLLNRKQVQPTKHQENSSQTIILPFGFILFNFYSFIK